MLSCPVESACERAVKQPYSYAMMSRRTQPCRVSAHSSGDLQYSNTDLVCFAGSYTARFFETISAIMYDRWLGSNLPDKRVSSVDSYVESSITRHTIYSLVPKNLVPLAARYLCIFDSKRVQTPVPCVRQDELRPVLGHDRLRIRVRLLSSISGFRGGIDVRAHRKCVRT